MANHYDTLKVARDAPVEVIKAAYKSLAFKYQPDRNAGSREAEMWMKLLNAAHDVLTNPSATAEHDAWLAEQQARHDAERVEADIARQDTGFPRNDWSSSQLPAQSQWPHAHQCPRCGTFVEHGYTVCTGCNAKVQYGYSLDEFLGAMLMPTFAYTAIYLIYKLFFDATMTGFDKVSILVTFPFEIISNIGGEYMWHGVLLLVTGFANAFRFHAKYKDSVTFVAQR